MNPKSSLFKLGETMPTPLLNDEQSARLNAALASMGPPTEAFNDPMVRAALIIAFRAGAGDDLRALPPLTPYSSPSDIRKMVSHLKVPEAAYQQIVRLQIGYHQSVLPLKRKILIVGGLNAILDAAGAVGAALAMWYSEPNPALGMLLGMAVACCVMVANREFKRFWGKLDEYRRGRAAVAMYEKELV